MNTKKSETSKGWDYLGHLYLKNGNISYQEIGDKFGIRASSVGAALSRLPSKKFSVIQKIGNNILPNNDS